MSSDIFAGNNVVIGSPRPDDVRDIQEVFYRSWLATYPNERIGITTDDIEDHFKDRLDEAVLAKRRERLLHPPEHTRMFVARADDRVVGLCDVEHHSDHNELRRVYVLPDFQQKGIGSQLWAAASGWIDRSKDTFVDVADYNEGAIAFYEKIGFRDTGERFSTDHFHFKSGTLMPNRRMILPGSVQ